LKAAAEKPETPKKKEKKKLEANYTLQQADPYAKLQKLAQTQQPAHSQP